MKLTPRRRQILRALDRATCPISPREIEGNSTLMRGWSRSKLHVLKAAGYVETGGSNFSNETCWMITAAGREALAIGANR
jgi:hypothetical protein